MDQFLGHLSPFLELPSKFTLYLAFYFNHAGGDPHSTSCRTPELCSAFTQKFGNNKYNKPYTIWSGKLHIEPQWKHEESFSTRAHNLPFSKKRKRKLVCPHLQVHPIKTWGEVSDHCNHCWLGCRHPKCPCIVSLQPLSHLPNAVYGQLSCATGANNHDLNHKRTCVGFR